MGKTSTSVSCLIISNTLASATYPDFVYPSRAHPDPTIVDWKVPISVRIGLTTPLQNDFLVMYRINTEILRQGIFSRRRPKGTTGS